jgi:hypothetical protein
MIDFLSRPGARSSLPQVLHLLSALSILRAGFFFFPLPKFRQNVKLKILKIVKKK